MIVSVLSLKGGVGKTTTAVHLAAVAARRGRQASVLDADPERSAHFWAQLAEALPFRVEAADRDRLAQQARELEQGGGVVVIDTPPNDRELLTRAALLSDHVVVPLKPTGLDVHRLRPTLGLLKDLDATRGGLDVALLFTHWDGRKVLSREAVEALERFPILEARVRDLTRYEQAFGAEPGYLLEYEAVWEELTRGEA